MCRFNTTGSHYRHVQQLNVLGSLSLPRAINKACYYATLIDRRRRCYQKRTRRPSARTASATSTDDGWPFAPSQSYQPLNSTSHLEDGSQEERSSKEHLALGLRVFDVTAVQNGCMRFVYNYRLFQCTTNYYKQLPLAIGISDKFYLFLLVF